MAFDHHRLQEGPFQIREQTDRFMAPEEVGGRVVNMELTEAGTLRSVVGPVEYRPRAYQDISGGAPDPLPLPPTINYTAPRLGLAHVSLQGGRRDCLLAHFDSGILHLAGWAGTWTGLISDGTWASDIVTQWLQNDDRPCFNTQFVSTPTGVVIIPQNQRAYFYDGEYIAPLGFEKPPAPPTAIGPDGSKVWTAALTWYELPNNQNYAHSGRTQHPQFGPGRLGTVRPDAVYVDDPTGMAAGNSNPYGGALEQGEWRAKVQFVDHWGNLSPLSPASGPIRFMKDENLTEVTGRTGAGQFESGERLKMQVAWTDIDTGPSHCVGRNLYRTKDQFHTSFPGYFWVPPNATDSPLTKMTLEDTVSQMYPDNIPDDWLITEAVDLVSVPQFKLARVAFGRLWIANTRSQPGMVRPSQPGFWGTFEANQEFYPDPNGAEITGLWTVNEGLLVFTESSTFLITEKDDSSGVTRFNAATLNPSVGCVAPDSLGTLPDGTTIWLGRQGFYSWDGEKIQHISLDIKDTILKRINKARRLRSVAAVHPKTGVYRCWIPVDGQIRNNLGLEYDGRGWRELTYMASVDAVCVTQDHRQYMLALGSVLTDETAPATHPSVWLLDHEAHPTLRTVSSRESGFETGWLGNPDSHRRKSPMTVTLWLRETHQNTITTIEVMRDWKRHPTYTDTGHPNALHTDEDPPLFWDTAEYDTTYHNVMNKANIDTHYTRRRPFWTRIDVSVPSCEVFRLRVMSEDDFEFIGLSYAAKDRHAGGMKQPVGRV